jgi:hypothetical protein
MVEFTCFSLSFIIDHTIWALSMCILIISTIIQLYRTLYIDLLHCKIHWIRIQPLRHLWLIVCTMSCLHYPIRLLDIISGCNGNYIIQSIIWGTSTLSTCCWSLAVNYTAYVAGKTILNILFCEKFFIFLFYIFVFRFVFI